MKLAYWKKYNKLYKNFSKVYGVVLRFAERLGSPYERRSHFGRSEKLSPVEYAAFIVFMIVTRGATYRQMEAESELYTGKHIDHATFARNFEKMPTSYFLDLIEETGSYLDSLLADSDQYVVDSSAITSPLKFETENKGIIVEEKIEFRGHVIASLHPEDNCVCIRRAISTSKRIADCEGAKLMLDQGNIKNVTLHADRGYDYERVYTACYENNIKPNIRPLPYTTKEGSNRLQGITEYDDKARIKKRGIIETIFGGLTNAGLMITRLKNPFKILSYTAIILPRHNILNITKNET